MLNTSPKLRTDRFGRLFAADITKWCILHRMAYLFIVTDTASHMIVGNAMHACVDKEGPIAALSLAICFYEDVHL